MKRVLLFFLGTVILFVQLSCSKKMTAEQYHQYLLELHTFYKNYFAVFATVSSTSEELEKWNTDFEKRKKSDLKLLETMKTSELDDELHTIYEDIISHIEYSNAHNHKEVITIKKKASKDLDDTSKLNRFYRDTSRYYQSKEEFFVEYYFKFINRHQLNADNDLLQLREELF